MLMMAIGSVECLLSLSPEVQSGLHTQSLPHSVCYERDAPTLKAFKMPDGIASGTLSSDDRAVEEPNFLSITSLRQVVLCVIKRKQMGYIREYSGIQ